MKKIEDIVYGSIEAAHKLNLYLPNCPVSSVFVYLHGGGLEAGDKSDADIFAPYLTERGIAVVSANYRMYPNAEYPDYIYDAAEVVAWADSYMRKELGCEKLYVGGSSAGGYLSMMLCFDRRYLASVGLDNSAVSGYFHDAGQPTAHFNVLKRKGVDPRRVIIDESAPLYYIGLENKYPPMRFIVSDDDMENRYEQIVLTLSTLSHFGYKNFDHVVMHGSHCEYCSKLDSKGEGVLGQMIYDFIEHVNR
ncbi:MAG: alpha/beta hydrolase [Clostridia bacterium]|nr:alpha/beta hydrolase [Clostridia bacterium]